MFTALVYASLLRMNMNTQHTVHAAIKQQKHGTLYVVHRATDGVNMVTQYISRDCMHARQNTPYNKHIHSLLHLHIYVALYVVRSSSTPLS